MTRTNATPSRADAAAAGMDGCPEAAGNQPLDPLLALVERWYLRAASERRESLSHRLGTYGDGRAKGASRALEGCARELHDLVTTLRSETGEAA